MERPLEIVFHNMKPSSAIEELIREKVAKLEKFYPRIVGCRVSVEAPHKQHKTGNVPEVHVEIQVPGQTLVVSRERRAEEKHGLPNARSSVRDAFDAATLKLQDYKRKQAREVKPHPSPLTAHVTSVFSDRDYGFITTIEGRELYFHRNSVMDAQWNELKRGELVHFIEADGDTGPTASKVWRANGRV
jgi:cold shock CspA family protein/ribosome-associated translation inhibitor RaiA